MRHAPRKSRKTFSLSRDAVAYLETYQSKKRESSLSGAVEALIHERKQQEEADRQVAQTRAYYDSLGEEEKNEDDAWGRFAESEIADSEA